MSPFLDWMKKNGIPLTREQYIHLVYFGHPPAEWTAEDEEQLPEQFQNWEALELAGGL
jgi:hypothetical protein